MGQNPSPEQWKAIGRSLGIEAIDADDTYPIPLNFEDYSYFLGFHLFGIWLGYTQACGKQEMKPFGGIGFDERDYPHIGNGYLYGVFDGLKQQEALKDEETPVSLAEKIYPFSQTLIQVFNTGTLFHDASLLAAEAAEEHLRTDPEEIVELIVFLQEKFSDYFMELFYKTH